MKQAVKRLALDEGMAAVGVGGTDRLKGPPSMDPTTCSPAPVPLYRSCSGIPPGIHPGQSIEKKGS